MAHLIVHRSAHAVRVALIMQRCRNTAHAGRHVVDNLVDFRRIHALMNVLLNIIEHRDIDLAALLNPCNLICILDNVMGRDDMSLRSDRCNLLVKCLMACLVFPAAFAPARIISSNFY